MKITKKYTFFLATKECFSNWYPVKFIHDNIEFNCSEQFMMYHKAKTFGDMNTAQEILNTKDNKNGKKFQQIQKELGRNIKNFNSSIWEQVAETIVYTGCKAKFEQNPDILQQLFNTADTILVEAASYDKVWGIGMSEDEPGIENSDNWLGQNKLGYILTRLREDLKFEHIT